jgi:sugar phosphate isomerase/epimerase
LALNPLIQLGIVADEVDRDPRRASAVCHPLGFRRYEIRNLPSGRVPLCDAADLRAVEEVMRATDSSVTAISPGLFKYTEGDAAFRKEMTEVYPRAAELAHRWSLPGLIVFGFHKPGVSEGNAASVSTSNPPLRIVEWLAEAGARAAADGLVLMVEPEPICWADSALATARLIEVTKSPALRMNYDPGNDAWLLNRDPLDAFDAAAPHIANVHIKDLRPLTRGAGHPEWVPAGEGMIDFRAHFAALWRAGYRGPISLEPHMDGSTETIRRCKEAVERL